MANQPPFATASTLTQQTATTVPSSFQTNLSSALPGTVTNTVAVNPNYQVPYAMIWNAGIEYNLARSMFLEVMYTGTRGVHLDELLGFSSATNGTTNAAGFTYDTTGAFSNFNALQVRLQKRMTRGLMFMARYTYSKSLDDASTIGGGGQTVIQNNADPRGDYGLSSFNMTHQFLGMFSYQLPFGDRQRFATKGWEKDVFGEWRVNGSFTAHSGTPFTVRVFSKNQACQNVPGTNSERADQSGDPSLSNPTVAGVVQYGGVQHSHGVLWRCAAKFGDRPRCVHHQFRSDKNDSLRARRLAAAGFQLECVEPAESSELYRAVDGAGLQHIRRNYECRGHADDDVHDEGQFLMRAQKTIRRRILAALAAASLLAAPLGAQSSPPQTQQPQVVPVNPRQGPPRRPQRKVRRAEKRPFARPSASWKSTCKLRTATASR